MAPLAPRINEYRISYSVYGGKVMDKIVRARDVAMAKASLSNQLISLSQKLCHSDIKFVNIVQVG